MGGTKGQQSSNSSGSEPASTCLTLNPTPTRPSLWVHTRRAQQMADANNPQKSMIWGSGKHTAPGGGGTGLLASSRTSMDSPSSATGAAQQSAGSGTSPATSTGPARSLLATPPARATRPGSPQPRSTSLKRVPSSSGPQVTCSMGFTTQQLQRQQAPQSPASPLTVTSAPRMLRTSNLEALPPKSPAKAQRFSRAPSTSIDNGVPSATIPVNSALLALHDGARTDRAASMPTTPASSSRRSSTLAFSSPCTSVNTTVSSSATTSATTPPAGETTGSGAGHTTTAWAVPASLVRARSGASPTQPAGACLSVSDWSADVSEAEGGPSRGSGSSRGSAGSACGQFAAVAAGAAPREQQQQQAVEGRRHSVGGQAPRAAWESHGMLSGSFVGSPKVGLSGAGVMRSPFSSLSLARTREGGSLSGSFVGSPKVGTSGNSTPTGLDSASNCATLTCLNPSKYTSSFAHAFAAEQPTEHESVSCGGFLSSNRATAAAACEGGSAANNSSGSTHTLQLGEDAHVGSFSMPPSMLRPASPGTAKLSSTARRSQEQPTVGGCAAVTLPSCLSRASSGGGGVGGGSGPLTGSSGVQLPGALAGGSASGSLLSGNAASAQRALRGPSGASPSAPVSLPMGARGAAGEGEEARVEGFQGSPPARSPFMYYGRISSSGNGESRGASMLRHSSMDPPGEARKSPAAKEGTGSSPQFMLHSGDGSGSPRPSLHGKVLSAPVAGAAAAGNVAQPQPATLGSAAISSTCLSQQQQQQQQQERTTAAAQQQQLPQQEQGHAAAQAAHAPQAAKPSSVIAAAASGAAPNVFAAAATPHTTVEGKQQAHAQRAPTPAAAPTPTAAAAAAAKQAGAAHPPCGTNTAGAEPAVAASTAVPPALPPLGIPPADYSGLLGGEVSEEHSAVLPGYTVGRVIGEGGFCQVRLGIHHLSKRRVAIKVIDKSKLTDVNEAKRIQREIRVMMHLTHECVIKLFEVVDSPTALYLIMEHAPNQSLLDYVRSRKRLAEGKAALILQQIVAGLQYCHRREVVHRDVKLENILLGADGNMKLIDFGLSAFFIPGKRLRVHCGSPSYAAPEIVSRKHYDGPPVDVWSLGVVLFACLAGHLPFHSSNGNKQELCQKIISGQYNMPAYLSPAAKDLLSRMLQVDPEQRATFEEVQAHPWVQAIAPWVPHGGSVYAFTGTLNEAVAAELEAVGYTRQQLLQALQARVPCYMTTSYFLQCEAKVEQGRAAEQAARQQRVQRQQLLQQEAVAAPTVRAAGTTGGVVRPLVTPGAELPAAHVGWAETGAGGRRHVVACGH